MTASVKQCASTVRGMNPDDLHNDTQEQKPDKNLPAVVSCDTARPGTCLAHASRDSAPGGIFLPPFKITVRVGHWKTRSMASHWRRTKRLLPGQRPDSLNVSCRKHERQPSPTTAGNSLRSGVLLESRLIETLTMAPAGHDGKSVPRQRGRTLDAFNPPSRLDWEGTTRNATAKPQEAAK